MDKFAFDKVILVVVHSTLSKRGIHIFKGGPIGAKLPGRSLGIRRVCGLGRGPMKNTNTFTRPANDADTIANALNLMVTGLMNNCANRGHTAATENTRK